MAIKLNSKDTKLVLIGLKVYRLYVADEPDTPAKAAELADIDRLCATYLRSGKALVRVGK
jgi:hypothetical protein